MQPLVASSTPCIIDTPVMLPPGRARLATKLEPTGSPVIKTTGMVVVALLTALTDKSPIRRRFEERFSVGRMARDYLALYDAVLRPALRMRS